MVRAMNQPTLVDRGFQVAYAGAYRMMRVYWRLRHPVTNGALVALWNRDELLLVRNSYVPYHCLPGGYVHRGESPRDAAVRELVE
jgi:8-oxo-dGTP pyrophosphatase MutT (NUDIX family)